MRFNHRIAATAFRAVARTFGEPVRIVPQVTSDYAEAQPDTDRAPVDTSATVALSPRIDAMDGARTGGGKMSSTTRLSTRRSTIWFPPDVYAGIGYPLRSGDKIILVERPGSPAYTVSRIPSASDRGDVYVTLVQDGEEE